MKEKQADRILKYLRTFGSIDPMQAIRDIGCYRLSARIKDLRDEGYDIQTKIVAQKNRYGETANFAVYSLGGRA